MQIKYIIVKEHPPMARSWYLLGVFFWNFSTSSFTSFKKVSHPTTLLPLPPTLLSLPPLPLPPLSIRAHKNVQWIFIHYRIQWGTVNTKMQGFKYGWVSERLSFLNLVDVPARNPTTWGFCFNHRLWLGMYATQRTNDGCNWASLPLSQKR